MFSVPGRRLEKMIESKRGNKFQARQILTTGIILFMAAATVLPASMAGAQSQYLEAMDLLYRNNSMATDYAEARLVGDFLDTTMRIDAGDLERHTVAGAYAPEAAGSPRGEANGLYAAYHVGGAEMDSLPTGYDADINGYTAGLQMWRGNALFALNLASTDVDGDFTSAGLGIGSEDQSMLSLGLHAMGTYRGNITWRGRIAGFKNDHDFSGGTGNSDSAEYESSCVNAGAMVGYLMKLGDTGMLLPEIGGEYLYSQRESFSSALGMSMDHFYDNQINGMASLRWTMRARLLGVDVVPSLAAGARMLFTDDKISETQTTGGTSTNFVKEMETLTTTVSASVLVHVAGHLQAELSYDSSFGGDATGQLASLSIRFPF
jgi:hypothetical protein